MKGTVVQNQFDHAGAVVQQAYCWSWELDRRRFLVPCEFLPLLPRMHLARDVLSAVTTMWYERKPRDNRIRTSLREVAEAIAVPPSGANLKGIYEALTFLRVYTIFRQEVITKVSPKGRKLESKETTWGFVSWVQLDLVRDGKLLPPCERGVLICITDLYAAALRNLAPATIPLSWLQAARSLPRRLVVPAKNLVYRLSAESQDPARWRFATLTEVCDFRSDRPAKRRRALENLLDKLVAAGVLERW
ncbi:MAG: hypothetical protein H5T84_08675, partial [Thermoleophilia bacterium]|nr:hypothetical protein [Thermoleophilia bacterium]